VDLGRALAGAVGIEVADRVQLPVALLDPFERDVEQLHRPQVTGAHSVGELPRVALPQLAHASPLASTVSSAIFFNSANESSSPAASTATSSTASASTYRPKCSCPQYDRIAIPSARFRVSGTTGYASSIRPPMQ